MADPEGNEQTGALDSALENATGKASVRSEPPPPKPVAEDPYQRTKTGDVDAYDPLEYAKNKAEAGMKRQWIAGYEDVISKAQANLQRLDTGGKLSDILNTTTLGNAPEMVALLHDAESDPDITAEGIIEVLHAALEGPLEVLLVPGGPSPELAQAAVDAINADPKHPYWSSKIGDTVHNMTTRLFQIAEG